MPQESLLAAVRQMLAERSAQLQAEAESKTAELLDEAQAQAARIREKAAADGRQRALNEETVIEQEIQLAALMRIEEVKRAFIAKMFSELGQELASLRQESGRYQALLAAWLKEARAQLSPFLQDGEHVVLAGDPRDRQILQEFLGEKQQRYIFEMSLQGWGGLKVMDEDRSVIVDNTLETRLENARGGLTSLLLERIGQAEKADMP